MDLEHDGAACQRVDLKLLAQLPATRAEGHMPLHLWDHFSFGVIVLDRHARVVFANAAARSMSVGGGAVRVNACLAARAAPRRFEEIIQTARDRNEICAMALPSRAGEPAMLALVSPLQLAQEKPFGPCGVREPAALLLLFDIKRPVLVPLTWMMQAYRLTRAEARVALAIASGASAAEAARQLRVSTNTLKTHLRRVYEKTGARRQTQLCRIVTMLDLGAAGATQG